MAYVAHMVDGGGLRFASVLVCCTFRWVWMRECVSQLISTCSRRLHTFSTMPNCRSIHSWSATHIRGFLPLELSGICSTASSMPKRPVHSNADPTQSDLDSTSVIRRSNSGQRVLFITRSNNTKLVCGMQRLSKSLLYIESGFKKC